MEASNLYRSGEIDKAMGAFAKAQGSYKPLIANEWAAGAKFANLKAILDSVREALSMNGLAFYQYIELLDEGSGAALLKSVLGHESGQYISSCARVITGKTDRQTGNIYEIHKRFHALMLLGIAPSENDPLSFDDNGSELGDQALIDRVRKPKEQNRVPIDRTDIINNDQYTELMIELDGHEDIAKDIMEVYNISTIADLPRDEYHKAQAKIRHIKKTTEDYLRRRR